MVSNELPQPVYRGLPAPAPAPRALPPQAENIPSPRGTFGPAGQTDVRHVKPMRGFASRIRRAKQVVHDGNKGDEAVTYV